MLTNLTIENYALIDRLDAAFDNRLNIITGETGAGKSILMGALSLLLGAKTTRMQSRTIRATASSRESSTSTVSDWNNSLPTTISSTNGTPSFAA
ncbi:MAG: AAA family ATPase [Alistipes sp.]